MTEEKEPFRIDPNRFLNAHDMAKVYRISSAKAFIQRFKRDRKKPPALRMFPDPVNPDTSRGHIFLWRPADVSALLNPAPKRGGR